MTTGKLTPADISYYLDFQYDADQLINWYYDNIDRQEPWPGRGYNILKHVNVAMGTEEVSNYPMELLRQFCERYNIVPGEAACQFVQIPAGHLMPLHTDTYSRKYAVIFPLVGSTPTVFCNKADRYITEVEHKENVPVLLRADIPHKTQALPNQDKINYQISFGRPPGSSSGFHDYYNVLNKLITIDRAGKS